jgi:hypothetical protein
MVGLGWSPITFASFPSWPPHHFLLYYFGSRFDLNGQGVQLGQERDCPHCSEVMPANRLTCPACRWVVGITPLYRPDESTDTLPVPSPVPLPHLSQYCPWCKERRELLDATCIAWNASNFKVRGICPICDRTVRRTVRHVGRWLPMGVDLYAMEIGRRAEYDPAYRLRRKVAELRFPKPQVVADDQTVTSWAAAALHDKALSVLRQQYSGEVAPDVMPLVLLRNQQRYILEQRFWAEIADAEERVLSDPQFQLDCASLRTRSPNFAKASLTPACSIDGRSQAMGRWRADEEALRQRCSM